MLDIPDKKIISIGIPCFNESLNIIPVYLALKKISTSYKKYNFEFIYVYNGSSDDTKRKIKELSKKDKRVIGIFLSRNFGPEASGQAALDKSTGDAFVYFEADLQDPPELISKLIQEWEKGNDIVVGMREKIEDVFFMTIFRKMFYHFLKKISYIDVPVNAGSFSLIDKKVMNAIKNLPEKYRFFRGLRSWVGFKTVYIKYQRTRRQRGKSSYNIFDYIHHSERGIFGFSYLFLDTMVYLGFILVFFSFLFLLGYLIFFFLFGNPIKGAVTIIVLIIFFGGIQLLAISIIGKYIQVIVEETKNRPVYIVDETVNLKIKDKKS